MRERVKRSLRTHFDWLLAGIYRAPLKRTRKREPPGVTAKLATFDDLLPYVDVPDWHLQRDFVKAALARGDLCVLGYLHGELATYGWVSYAVAPHKGTIWVKIGAGHRYNYKAFTAMAFRGRHLRGSYGLLAERDRQEGVTHSLSFIDVNNTASIKSELRNGGRRIGYAGYVRCFGLFVPFATPKARRHGFGFTKRP